MIRSGNQVAQMIGGEIGHPGIAADKAGNLHTAQADKLSALAGGCIVSIFQLPRLAVDGVNRLAIDDLFDALVIAIIFEAGRALTTGPGRPVMADRRTGRALTVDKVAIILRAYRMDIAGRTLTICFGWNLFFPEPFQKILIRKFT